jgi:hypothetical protein
MMTTVLDSREAGKYREIAGAFCALVEDRARHPAPEWLKAVHLLLPQLYASALELPHIEPDTETAGLSAVTHEEWQALYSDLTDRIGHWGAYFQVSDPYDEADHEPLRTSLADDLADIYRDLKNGLFTEVTIAYDHPSDVLWTWRFDFESHWAAHATSALRALQTALLVHYAENLPETFHSRRIGGQPAAG